jgi:Ca2+-binding EF-hand superfamily protein
MLSYTMADKDEQGNLLIKIDSLPQLANDLGLKLDTDTLEKIKGELPQIKAGLTSFDAVTASLVDHLMLYSKANIYGALDMLDSDGDHKIPFEELEFYLKNFGAPMKDNEMEELLSLAKKDADGNVDINNFTSVLTKQ